MNHHKRQVRARAKAKKMRIMRNPLGASKPAVAEILKELNQATLDARARRDAKR